MVKRRQSQDDPRSYSNIPRLSPDLNRNLRTAYQVHLLRNYSWNFSTVVLAVFVHGSLNQVDVTYERGSPSRKKASTWHALDKKNRKRLRKNVRDSSGVIPKRGPNLGERLIRWVRLSRFTHQTMPGEKIRKNKNESS